jgi:hypothetical protein
LDDDALALIKPHSLFDLMSVYLENKNDKLLEIIIKPYLEKNLTDLMPEEVVILAKLLSRFQDEAFVTEVVQSLESTYILNYLQQDQISFLELCKIFSSMKLHLGQFLSSDFIKEVFDEHILKEVVENKVPAECLVYIMPLLEIGQNCELKDVQKMILQALKQKNFSASTYVLATGQLLEKINVLDEGKNPKEMLVR